MPTATDRVNAVAITIGLFGVAGFLLYKGDTAHALMLVALAVPNSQQILAPTSTAIDSLTTRIDELKSALSLAPAAPAAPPASADRATPHDPPQKPAA